MMIPMMFRPLNQIANKFNTLQMGMVAADRVFKVLNTQSKISNRGDYSPDNISGNITTRSGMINMVKCNNSCNLTTFGGMINIVKCFY